MAKISVIVPIYNVEKYVEKCINSLIHQTHSELEIICIDDASTDKSLEIVKRIAKTDSRIQILCHTKNFGTLQARKHGVEQATGRYIMFLDSDDWLEIEACEKLNVMMSQEQADVIQFGTNLVPAVPLSTEMITWVRNFLKPYPGRLEKRQIMRSCFIEDKFDFNITDKIWRTDLCKKAFEKMEDMELIASEDRYAFFILTYYAESYMGIQNQAYYNYNLGIGITGSDVLDLNRFEKRCTGVKAVEAIRRFLDDENVSEEYQDEFEQFENKILLDCVDCWHNKLQNDDIGFGFDILLKYWQPEKVISAIAQLYFEQGSQIIFQAQAAKCLQCGTTGIYYRYLGYEPMTKYIRDQINVIYSAESPVVIFTDSDNQINQESWNVPIVLLPPSADSNWNQYSRRGDVFAAVIKKYHVKQLFYASPTSHIAWLDMLLLKMLGVAVLNMNEEAELKRFEREKEMQESQQNLIAQKQMLINNYEQLLNSKTYKIGAAITKIPIKLKQFISKGTENE